MVMTVSIPVAIAISVPVSRHLERHKPSGTSINLLSFKVFR